MPSLTKEEQVDPKQAPSNKTRPNGGAVVNNVEDHDAAINEMLKLLRDFHHKVGSRPLKSILTENNELKLKLKNVQIAREVGQDDLLAEKQRHRAKQVELDYLDKTHADGLQELDELKRSLVNSKENEAKTTEDFRKLTMRMKDQETSQNREAAEKDKFKDMADRMKSQVSELRKELDSVKMRRDELETLESFGLILQPLDSQESELVPRLRGIFSRTTTLFEDAICRESLPFGPDSPLNWTTFKDKDLVKATEIPLPRSNTLAARQMRFAMALKVFATALCEYVFQPMFLDSEEDWIEKEMQKLSKDEPAQETHLRSILLAVNPAQQTSIGMDRAKEALTDVKNVLLPLVPYLKRASLSEDLEQLCEEARVTWCRVQMVKELIEPDFRLSSDDEWDVLNLPKDPSASGPDSPSQTRPGQGVPFSGNKVKKQVSTEVFSLKDDEDYLEVWPAFGTADTLLCPGYTLVERQLKVAKGELQMEQQKEEQAKREQEEAEKKNEQEKRNQRAMSRSTKANGSGPRRRGSEA